MKYGEQEFIQRLIELAPGWVDAINNYGLMTEVFMSFVNNDSIVFSKINDEEFLNFANHAMLDWDI